MTVAVTRPGSIDIAGGRPLRGTLTAPGDKSISHRALMVAARADGASIIRGLSGGDDVRRTVTALSQLGARFAGNHEVELRVTGGAERLRESDDVVDVGNSGTGIRLHSGYATPFNGLTVLTGDDSIRRRPMDRVVAPLREMGARIDGREGGRLAPLIIRGGSLRGIDYTPPVASAQVKAAVLLAGLGASGVTVVRENIITRVHTEEILRLAGADVEVESTPDFEGRIVRVRESELSPFEMRVPADPSQVAFFVVAACVVPGSEIHCK
ncbi:MAG TPA: hypothetical protein VGS21_04310, partial [Acidimicrobiales bacterium]|nr:hypothetical protein [Acidimicrobiales bacterium]